MTQIILHVTRIYLGSTCPYSYTPSGSASSPGLEHLNIHHTFNDLDGKCHMYFTGMVIVVMHIPQRRLAGASVAFSQRIWFFSVRSLYTAVHVHGYRLTPNQLYSPSLSIETGVLRAASWRRHPLGSYHGRPMSFIILKIISVVAKTRTAFLQLAEWRMVEFELCNFDLQYILHGKHPLKN